MVCKQCGAALPQGAAFCPACGMPQAGQGEAEQPLQNAAETQNTPPCALPQGMPPYNGYGQPPQGVPPYVPNGAPPYPPQGVPPYSGYGQPPQGVPPYVPNVAPPYPPQGVPVCAPPKPRKPRKPVSAFSIAGFALAVGSLLLAAYGLVGLLFGAASTALSAVGVARRKKTGLYGLAIAGIAVGAVVALAGAIDMFRYISFGVLGAYSLPYKP